MVIWGPDFNGERFDLLIGDSGRRDEALDGLRRWIEARAALDDRPFPLWPAGCFIVPESPASTAPDGAAYPAGTVLFPPERLIMRSLQAEGDGTWLEGAESLVNPELAGEGAAAFTAGAILYRIFSGAPPFPNQNRDLLHQDIREGVFLPARFAAPGLNEALAALIDRSMAKTEPPAAAGTGTKSTASFTTKSTAAFSTKSSAAANASTVENSRPALKEFQALLGPLHSPGATSFFRVLEEAEQVKYTEAREQFQKKKNITVNTRRFVIRNSAIIFGACIAVLVAGLIIRSAVIGRANRPNTRGMASTEVVETYYSAFGALDHMLMDACVIQKAGKDDISMVTNIFVLSRVRQAYETAFNTIIPAQQWVDAGAQPTELQVFGVSGLTFERVTGDEGADEIQYRVSYTLWVPAEMGSPAGDETAPPAEAAALAETAAAKLPMGYPYTDDIRLIRYKGDWRIAEIRRSLAAL
jgi:hypothetical protein